MGNELIRLWVENQTAPGTEIKKVVSHDARRKSGAGSPPPTSSRKRKRPTVATPVAPETRLLETLAALQAQTSKVRAASSPNPMKIPKTPKAKGPVNAAVKKLHGRHQILMAASAAAKSASVSAKETAKALKKAAKTQQSFATSCAHLAGLLADEAGFYTDQNQDETSSSSDGSETGDDSDQ